MSEKKQMTDKKKDKGPMSYQIARWHGIVFSAIFLIYGVVKIILGILDRNYSDMIEPFMFLLLGLILVSFVIGFTELRKWGWQGLVAINGLVVVFSPLKYARVESYVLLVASAVVLYLLFSADTRAHLIKGR